MEMHDHLGNEGFPTGSRDGNKEVLSIKHPFLNTFCLRRIEFTDSG
jgi:hypothetical protein